MKRLLLVLCLMFALVARADIKLPPLEYHNVNGQNRSMIVWAPEDLPDKAPLVISCHGYNQDAGYQAGQSHWENCADSAKFVIVYPNGIDRAWDLSGTRDIKFIDWIIDEMVNRYNITTNRVYLTGFSMGGMFTYYYIKNQGDKIAAAAPVSGPDGSPSWKGIRRVPILHTHGTADNYGNVYNQVKSWANSEGLTQEKFIEHYAGRGYAENAKPSSIAMLYSWTSTDPNDKNEVALLAIRDKGHWHSEDVGPGVSTTQEIWKFCKRYSLSPEPPRLKKIDPENNCFDLDEEDDTFTATFDGNLSVADVKGEFILGESTVQMQVVETTSKSKVSFVIPQGSNILDGTYTLRISNILNPEGGDPASYAFTYSFGNTTAGDAYKSRLAALIVRGWEAYNYTADATTTSIVNARNRLKKNLDKYESWSSKKPSTYESVCDRILRDIEILEATLAGVSEVAADVQCVQYFTIDGRPVAQPEKGLYIQVRTLNGVKTVGKTLLRLKD